MDPLGWGFLIHNEKMMPVKMKQRQAPPNILKIVCCGCQDWVQNNDLLMPETWFKVYGFMPRMPWCFLP